MHTPGVKPMTPDSEGRSPTPIPDTEKPDSDYEYELQRYDVYLAERRSIIQGRREAHRSFDYAVIAVATAGLVLGIGIYGGATVQFLNPTALFGSWIAFSTAILSVIISFYTSQLALARDFAINEEIYQSNIELPRSLFSGVTNFLNFVTLVTFCLGLALLIVAFVRTA
jgi:disulfide bond formation protein DsbB